MLTLNPNNRFTCQELLDHQFFKEEPEMCNSQFNSIVNETHEYHVRNKHISNNSNNNALNTNNNSKSNNFSNNHNEINHKNQSIAANNYITNNNKLDDINLNSSKDKENILLGKKRLNE